MPAAAPVAAGDVSPIRTPWLQIALVVVVSRLLLWCVGVLTLRSQGREAGFDWATWTDLGCRWDCGWYLGIINQGYGIADATSGETNWPFYPMYPMAVRALGFVTGIEDARITGMLFSLAAFTAALGLIHRYARVLGNSASVAMTAVLLVAFLPQGIVFSAVYTESLFLLLLVATMLALRLQHYLLAGVCAALLSATRSNGIFILVFIAAQLWMQLGTREFFRPWRTPRAFVPLLMAPLGAFAFWVYAYRVTGDGFAMSSAVRHGWGWAWESPLANFLMHFDSGYEPVFWVCGSLLVAACSLLLLRYRWYPEFVFAAAIFLLIWGGAVPNSMWRYSMVLFPAWIALARALERHENTRMAVLLGWGLFGGFLMHAWTMQLRISV